MKTKILAMCAMLVLLTVFMYTSLAENTPNQINADPVFASVTITLTTSKSALFSAHTYGIVGSIKVASCWLQKKVGDNWTYYCWLPAPTE